MKFTLSWLKDHLDTEASVDEIAETLTDLGLEVEEISNPADRLKDFTLGYVKHAEKHPDADKLRVCKVETDEGEMQIICGAPNAREGITVVLISHRPNLLRFVDRVLVLNKGRVHLFGSRDEILQKMTAKPAAPKAEAVATAKPSVRIAGKQEQGDG